MHNIIIEASIVNMETIDLANFITGALANNTNMKNVHIHRITVEETDAP